jgi:hypothetical protein
MRIVGIFLIFLGCLFSYVAFWGLLMWSDAPVTHNPFEYTMAAVGILTIIMGIAFVVKKRKS